MTTTTTTAGPDLIALPDGTTWHCPTRADALMIWREIFDGGGYRDAVADVPPGGTVLDVGAHTGLASLYVGRTVPDARVLAFEPAAALHRCLTANLRTHVPRGTAYRCALGAREGTARFTYYPQAPCQSGLFADAVKDGRATRAYLANHGVVGAAADYLLTGIHTGATELVYVTTVSAVLAERGLTQVDLLKIDVERGEYDVLLGVDDADWARISTVVLEAHEDDGGVERCVDLLDAHGYDTEVAQAPWLVDSGLFDLTARRRP